VGQWEWEVNNFLVFADFYQKNSLFNALPFLQIFRMADFQKDTKGN
jgi:hypothetical protein